MLSLNSCGLNFTIWHANTNRNARSENPHQINSELSNIQIGKLIRSLKTCQETTAGNPEQETPLETEEIELDFLETTIIEILRAVCL